MPGRLSRWVRWGMAAWLAPALAAQFPKIVSNVELVNMVFTVQDHSNHFVTGLTAADFRLSENGRPQTIKYFSAENDVPLTIGLLIDTSGSQRTVLEEEKQTSHLFFQHVLRPQDRAFVASFDTGVYLLQDLTNDQEKLGTALDRAVIGRSTALWDAIFLACKSRMSKETGRKALIVVTDGGATASEYSLADATRLALDTNTIVYFLYVTAGGGGGFGGGGGGPDDPSDLEGLAKKSGGRTFDGSDKQMQKAFDEIEQELRNQYTLAYKSDRPQHDGTFRRVQITLAKIKGDTIRTRVGYTMPAF